MKEMKKFLGLSHQNGECNGAPWQVEGNPTSFQFGGLNLAMIVLGNPGKVEASTFAKEVFGRRVTVLRQMWDRNMTQRMRVSFHQLECNWVLLAVKMGSEGKTFFGSTQRVLDCHYVATSGPGMQPISIQDELEAIADFGAIKRPTTICSAKYLPYKLKKFDFEVIDEVTSMLTGDSMNDGCGFIPDAMLLDIFRVKNLDQHLAVQVRIYGALGMWKGMLCRKPNIAKIQLVRSMMKVGPSVHPAANNWVCLYVVGTFPSGNNGLIKKSLEGRQPRQSWRSKPLSPMIIRLLNTLGVPRCVIEMHERERVPKHA